MREFLKAVLLITLIVAVLLSVLRWAPLPFPHVNKIKQNAVLRKQIFPVMDSAAAATRGLARDGINLVPQLKQQKWLVDFFAEPAKQELAKNGEGRSPAAEEEAYGYTGDIPAAVSGDLHELLGDKFEIVSQSVIQSSPLFKLRINFPKILTLNLREDSEVNVWTVKTPDRKLVLVELKSGVVFVKQDQSSIMPVAISMPSGAYRMIQKGEGILAGVKVQNSIPVEGFDSDTSKNMDDFFQNMKAVSTAPSMSLANKPAKKQQNKKPSVAVPAPAAEQDEEMDREPAGSLESDLQ